MKAGSKCARRTFPLPSPAVYVRRDANTRGDGDAKGDGNKRRRCWIKIDFRETPTNPPRWFHDPYNLSQTLSTDFRSTSALSRSLWKPRPISAFPTLAPYRLPLLGRLTYSLTLPRFSPNPFCPCLLPQIQRRCHYLSKQKTPCLSIHAIDPRPTTWPVPPAPLTRPLSRPESGLNGLKIKSSAWFTMERPRDLSGAGLSPSDFLDFFSTGSGPRDTGSTFPSSSFHLRTWGAESPGSSRMGAIGALAHFLSIWGSPG